MGLVVEESKTKLKGTSMLLWKSHRQRLESRLRRLDLLRMRFLVLHMGLIAGGAIVPDRPVERRTPVGQFARPERPNLSHHAHSVSEGLVVRKREARKGDVRKEVRFEDQVLTPTPIRTQSLNVTGHTNSEVGFGQKMSFLDVVGQLQKSPLLLKRKKDIEMAEEEERKGKKL